MSYDLAFWKYKKDVYLNNDEVYFKVSDEEEIIDGLEYIPIDNILEKIAKTFSHWQTDDSHNYNNFNNGAGAFETYTKAQFVLFSCNGMEGDDLNLLIDIMLEFECPLYDPQVQERFDKK